MSTIIVPSLTREMVIEIFKYLVSCELRKISKNPQDTDFRAGCQEGMIACLTLMFGTCDDDLANVGYDRGSSWLHIIDRIVDEHLTDVVALLENSEWGLDNFDDLSGSIDKAVREFDQKVLIEALKVYL